MMTVRASSQTASVQASKLPVLVSCPALKLKAEFVRTSETIVRSLATATLGSWAMHMATCQIGIGPSVLPTTTDASPRPLSLMALDGGARVHGQPNQDFMGCASCFQAAPMETVLRFGGLTELLLHTFSVSCHSDLVFAGHSLGVGVAYYLTQRGSKSVVYRSGVSWAWICVGCLALSTTTMYFHDRCLKLSNFLRAGCVSKLLQMHFQVPLVPFFFNFATVFCTHS